MESKQPMVIVIYMDRLVMSDAESMKIISTSVQQAFEAKGGNTVTLFVPTDGQERIECINPAIATEEQINKINQMIDDIAATYDVGHDLEEDLEGGAVKSFKTDES
jgi:hypothetical protein